MDVLPPTRKVTLQDYDGNVLAGQTFSLSRPGFWQYGSVSWSTFATWLDVLIRTDHPSWAISDIEKDSADRKSHSIR
jgi:hypothetical protein